MKLFVKAYVLSDGDKPPADEAVPYLEFDLAGLDAVKQAAQSIVDRITEMVGHARIHNDSLETKRHRLARTSLFTEMVTLCNNRLKEAEKEHPEFHHIQVRMGSRWKDTIDQFHALGMKMFSELVRVEYNPNLGESDTETIVWQKGETGDKECE